MLFGSIRRVSRRDGEAAAAGVGDLAEQRGHVGVLSRRLADADGVDACLEFFVDAAGEVEHLGGSAVAGNTVAEEVDGVEVPGGQDAGERAAERLAHGRAAGCLNALDEARGLAVVFFVVGLDAARREAGLDTVAAPVYQEAPKLDAIAYPFPLANGETARIYMPKGITKADVDRLSIFLEALVISPVSREE